ncbi:MAG TPA: hypothetical protein VHB98_16740 [Chloroflexota bacterium]|nr:hypothetical protein [Chloroflexota bacterium]
MTKQMKGTEMDDMQLSEVLKRLMQAGGFSAMSRVTMFKGYRTNTHGQMKAVMVELYDAGPEKPGLRYQVIARDEDGRVATGNPADGLEAVLANVHWWELDGHPRP